MDPCLLYKKNDKGETQLLVVMYVDDVLVSGQPKTIRWFLNEFKKKFKITELGQMKKHLGIWYEWKKDSGGEPYVKATMNEMIKEIVAKYEESTNSKVKDSQTPGAPGKTLKKNEDPDKIIKESEYRSIMGKVLYYVNKMDMTCANAARELSQHLSNPNQDHWKALGKIVGYIKGRINRGKVMRRPKELRVVAWGDSDYAKSDDRKSITGGICSIGGCPTFGCSKGQACVCLSSSDSEYVALGMIAQEVRFQQQLLDEIAKKQHVYPGVIFEDNMGAKYLVENKQVSQRTKHIDVRRHFIRTLSDRKLVKVLFTPSEANKADICTKNVTQNLFDKHSNEIYDGRLIYDIDSSEEIVDGTMPTQSREIEGLPHMISNEKVMSVDGENLKVETDWDDVNSSDFSVEIIYPKESMELNFHRSNDEQSGQDEELTQEWNGQETIFNGNRRRLQNARNNMNIPRTMSNQVCPTIMIILKVMTPAIYKVREYMNNMVLTGIDYRVNTRFRKELKREIEFRNVRRMWNVRAIMDTEYPSDDSEDSDFSSYEDSSDETMQHMAFSTIDDGMILEGESDVTHTYDMIDLNEKVNEIDKKTNTILDKVQLILAHSEDVENLMNANIGDDEARNEVVDRHFIHVDMALAKQNQEIMYVRDKLYTEIMMLRNDVRRAGIAVSDQQPPT